MSNADAVFLRPMTEQDLDKVLTWRNREGVRKNMYTSHLITPDEHAAWWGRHSQNPETRLLMAVAEGRDVGVVTFNNYSGENGVATWAFYAGDSAMRGVGSMMEAAALEYAFTELKLRKLECEVLDFNLPVVRLHMRHGFRIEGIFRQAYERGGEFHDIYRLALLKKDWIRYIRAMVRNGKAGRLGVTGKVVTRKVQVDHKMVEAFACATGDRNPVHFDDDYARGIGFTGKITHGMLVGSLFSELFASEFPGEGTVYLSQSLEFLKPVPVGTELTVRVKVLSQFGRRLLLECECSLEEEVCLQGRAEVLAPNEFSEG